MDLNRHLSIQPPRSLKWSPFTISIKYDRHLYLYNTINSHSIKLNGSVVSLNKAFSKKNHPISEKLQKSGILITDSEFDLKTPLKEVINKKHKENGAPSYVIAPSLKCNFSCSYCFEELNFDRMSPEECSILSDHIIYTSTLNILSREPTSINWYGGEPLLTPSIIDDITSKLNQAKVDYRSQITTNGYYLNRITYDRIKLWNLSIIQVSIDGSAKKHNSMRFQSNNHETHFSIIQNIEEFLESSRNVELRLRINLHIDDVDNIANMIVDRTLAPLKRFENLSIFLSEIDTSNRIIQNSLIKAKGDLYTLFEKNGFHVSKKGKVNLKTCSCSAIMKNSWHVGPNLELYGCYSDFGHENKAIGKITNSCVYPTQENSYATLNIYDKQCKSCEIFALCSGGGCPYKIENGYSAPSIEFCSTQKKHVQGLLINKIKDHARNSYKV